MIPATDIETARAVRIEDEIARRGITLKRVGTEMIGPCAVCGGRDRFAINLIIAALQDRGQWPADQQHYKTFRPPPGQPLHDQRHHDAERTTRALSIWRSATPACGTSVETYLRSRGIVAPIPGQPDQWLVIETTLSVMQACSLPGWAALSANGITSSFCPARRRWC